MRYMRPRIAALVVTWNRRDDVIECVESLQQVDSDFLQIYVVDNASEDGTSVALKNAFPSIHLLRSEKNLGFGGGNNLGLTRILNDGADAVFLVNDDVVVAPDALGIMVSAFNDQSIAVVGPKILVYGTDDLIWAAGAKVDENTGIAIQRHYAETDYGQADQPMDVDYAVGCAMLVRTAIIRQIGKFDIRYYMYYEEAEWCRRIRRSGYRVVYLPDARVWHKVRTREKSRNNAPYYFSRNRLLYLKSCGLSEIKIACLAASDILQSALAHAVKGRTHESHLMIKGVLDYYAGNFGRLRIRT